MLSAQGHSKLTPAEITQCSPHAAGVCNELTQHPGTESERIRRPARLPKSMVIRSRVEEEPLEESASAKRLALLGRLAAEIAHEINNPLNAILLTAETALRFPGGDVKLAFQLICDEASRAGLITKNVLGYARKAHVVQTLGDLNEVVRQAVSLACRYNRSDRLVCAMELDDSLPQVSMNSAGIEQVLVNLIKNAAESASRLVSVVVRTVKTKDGVDISVTDDGPGIQTDVLRDLFTPFNSTKHNNGGTGLGLSICRRIVDDHGGKITVKSLLSHGSVFTVKLNGDKAKAADSPAAREQPPAQASTPTRMMTTNLPAARRGKFFSSQRRNGLHDTQLVRLSEHLKSRSWRWERTREYGFRKDIVPAAENRRIATLSQRSARKGRNK